MRAPAASQPSGQAASDPEAWRERVVRALEGDGITLPPHVDAWRACADTFFVYFGAIYLVGLLAQLADLVHGFLTTGTLQLPESGEPRLYLASALLLVPAGVAYYLICRPLHFMSSRRLRMAFRGTNALHAVRKARRPPILYLRSFPFDERASAVGKWSGRIERNFGFGIMQDDTAEMKVVRALRWFGPVLAIGRPGEQQAPPGALRFYVHDDLWQSKIEEIAPGCQLVVLATGESAGLQWEIEHVIRTVPPLRVLIWPHVNVGHAAEAQRQSDWERLAERLGGVLPQPLPSWDRVRKAHFIAFDERWAAVCIPSEAYGPALWERLVTRPSVHGLGTLMRSRRMASVRPKPS